MAISTPVLPSKCCGCSLRASSMVVGAFTLIFSITLLGLSAAGGSALNKHVCSEAQINGFWKSVCVNTSEAHKMVVNLMAILALLNAFETVMSIGLIWGANKRIPIWVTGWLVSSTFWILLHSTLAVAYVFAATDGWAITVTAVLGIFFLGTTLLSMLTVLSFRNELLHSRFRYSIIDEPIPSLLEVSSPIQHTGNVGRAHAQPVDASDGLIPQNSSKD